MPQTLDELRTEAREKLVADGYTPDQANKMALLWYPVPRQSAPGHARNTRKGAAVNSAGKPGKRVGNPGNRGNTTPRTLAQRTGPQNAMKERWAKVRNLGLHSLAELKAYEAAQS